MDEPFGVGRLLRHFLFILLKRSHRPMIKTMKHPITSGFILTSILFLSLSASADPITLRRGASVAPLKTSAQAENSAPDISSSLAEKASVATEAGERKKQLNQAQPGHKQDVIGKGDTLAIVLARAGAPANHAADAFAAVTKIFNPKDLRPGQQVSVQLTPAEDGEGVILQSFALKASVERDVAVMRQPNGTYKVEDKLKPLTTEVSRASGTIDSSLFVSGTSAGIPVDVMMELIKIFSYDVDFQRDIQPGDGFEVVFEQKLTPDRKLARNGRLLYAAMNLSGTNLKLFRFEGDDGFVDFYTPKGESVRKALLKTPIDGAKLTSGFGMRQHPILGFSLMHKGVDFGAPTGTPIQAAGDGTIKVYGGNGAYGNYAQVQHNGQYATAYAHMSRFAPGLRVGSRVRQGQIIGYVGTTGRSTGPHLHYEVLAGGSQINPLSVKLPSGRKLEGKDLRDFMVAVKSLEQKRDGLPQPIQVASAR